MDIIAKIETLEDKLEELIEKWENMLAFTIAACGNDMNICYEIQGEVKILKQCINELKQLKEKEK